MKKINWTTVRQGVIITVVSGGILAGLTGASKLNKNIQANKETNIEQSKDIEALQHEDTDLKNLVEDGFKRLEKSQEKYFEILNDKIDNK